MVLLNMHPDYLSERVDGKIYADFLQAIKHRRRVLACAAKGRSKVVARPRRLQTDVSELGWNNFRFVRKQRQTWQLSDPLAKINVSSDKGLLFGQT